MAKPGNFQGGPGGKEWLPALLILAAGMLISTAVLSWWRGTTLSAPAITRRLPLPGETSGVASVAAESPVRIGETFLRFDGVPSKQPGFWPAFRGSLHDNVAPVTEKLADSWPAGGPPRLWSVKLGEGYAGPAIRNGCAYVLDYDGAAGADALRCFSMDDGREIWRRSYKVHIKRNHGISRTVPAVTDQHAVTIGPRCHVMCVDARTGDFRWGMDLERDWDVEVPMWYTGQCPLIDGDQVILGVGGKVLLAGVDCQTGKVLWETPNPRKWKMSHSSVMPMEFGGRKMYVYCAVGGIVGVSAEKQDAGAVLWETDQWNFQVVAPTPVPVGEGRFWITSGYGAGSALFQLMQEGGRFSVKLLKKVDKKTFACEQHTPVFYQGYLYTVLPADAGATRKLAVCMAPDGRVVWTSATSDRFGLGPFMVADGKLLILEDDGLLTMIRATPEGYHKMTQAKVLEGKEAWAPLALAGGRLLVRDFGTLRCLDMRGGQCATPDECRYDVGAVKKTGTNGLNLKSGHLIKPALSNLTALAVGPSDRIVVGAKSGIEVLDAAGKSLLSFSIPGPARALAVASGGDIYAGLDDHVEVYGSDGARKAVWKSPHAKTMITSVAVSSNFVFVADCQNRVVWRFTPAGEVSGRIGDKDPSSRPDGFVVPSAFFDVAPVPDGSLWAVNPGMHRLEHFAADGRFLSSWGRASAEDDGFCGCCNPSNMTLAPDGSFVTSEKHIVRVKRYDADGRFKGIISGQAEWGKDVVGLDLAVDSTGRILVLDPSADAVRVYR